MNLKKAWLVIPAAAALALTACAGGGNTASSGSGDKVVTANGNEPQNPLLPGLTNENGGGRILTVLFSQLVRYETDGTAVLDVAESIEPNEDASEWTIKLHNDRKFSDGTPVQAHNFIKAWNLITSKNQQQAAFFSFFEGTDDEGNGEITGLTEIDDYTFTAKLKNPTSDFMSRLGYVAYAPLPDSTLADPEAGGQAPVGNGPYKMASADAWEHNVKFTTVPNEHYVGDTKAQNEGVTFVFYTSLDAGYQDLSSDSLDILDGVPASVFKTYESELPGRTVNQPYAGVQYFTIPQYLPHFSGEEGRLRREAISLAVDRDTITKTIFNGTRTPAKDFTAPTLEGYDANIAGNDVLTYNPDKAKELWAQADAISPWDGTFTIAYNSDGGHKEWVDATANSIKNTLGIDAEGNPFADFKSLLDAEDKREMTGAFRNGWQGDYPALYNFLQPQFATGADANKGDYSNSEFDSLMIQGSSATTTADAVKTLQKAQMILLQDLPAIPLWYPNVSGGWSKNVDNVQFDWKGQPVLYKVTKK